VLPTDQNMRFPHNSTIGSFLDLEATVDDHEDEEEEEDDEYGTSSIIAAEKSPSQYLIYR